MLIPDLGNFELWGKSRAKCLFWKVLGEEARLSNHVFLGLRGIVGNARLGTVVFWFVCDHSWCACFWTRSCKTRLGIAATKVIQESLWCRFMVLVDFLHSNSSVCAWVRRDTCIRCFFVLVLLLGFSAPPCFRCYISNILAWTILRVCIDWSIYKLPSCYLT